MEIQQLKVDRIYSFYLKTQTDSRTFEYSGSSFDFSAEGCWMGESWQSHRKSEFSLVHQELSRNNMIVPYPLTSFCQKSLSGTYTKADTTILKGCTHGRISSGISRFNRNWLTFGPYARQVVQQEPDTWATSVKVAWPKRVCRLVPDQRSQPMTGSTDQCFLAGGRPMSEHHGIAEKFTVLTSDYYYSSYSVFSFVQTARLNGKND